MIPAKAMIQMKTAAETGTDFEQSILYTFRDLRVEISSDLFLLYRKLLRNVPIKQKTLREDATRCIWNMSAKADCI